MKFFKDILCRALIFSVLISPWLLSASAERVDYCDSIPEDFAGWNSSVSLPKFDPEMGTLTAVDLLCILNLSGQVLMENTNPLPGNFTISLSGALTGELPSSENIYMPINHIIEGNLSGYDGASDYAGASGLNSTESVPTDEASMSISNLEDFLAGAPGERITVPVRVEIGSLVKMPGNSMGGVISKAGAKICVFYTYGASSAEDGGIK